MLTTVSSSADNLDKLQKAILSNRLTPQNLIYSILIFIASLVIANIIPKLVDRTMLVYIKNRAVRNIVLRLIKYAIIVIGLTVALGFIGIDLGWFSIIFALFVFMFYLTLRPLVENMGAGFLIQSRPAFRIGSLVKVKNIKGEVIDINSRSTVIRTADHRAVHIPNATVLDELIIVYDAAPSRRSSLKFKLGLDQNINDLQKTLIPEVMKIEGVLNVPRPKIQVSKIEDGNYLVALSWWHNSKAGSGSKTKDAIARRLPRITKLK